MRIMLVFLFLTPGLLFATLDGKVVDEEGVGLGQVKIEGLRSGEITFTQESGHFILRNTPAGDSILLSRMDREPLKLAIPENPQGTWTLVMKEKPVLLPETRIQANKKEYETCYPEIRTYIYDYGFLGDEIAVISRQAGAKSTWIEILNADNEIQQRSQGSQKISELFNDFEGNLWALGEDTAFKVVKSGENLSFLACDKDSFEKKIRPCHAKWNGRRVYDFTHNNLDKTLYWEDPELKEGEGRFIARICNEEKIRQMREEGFPVDRKFEASELVFSSLSENPASMTEMFFLSKTFFSPLYVAAFSKGKSLFLFDHANGNLLTFHENNELPSRVAVRYHLQKGWKKEIIHDTGTGKFYTLFDHYGQSKIAEINMKTGELGYQKEIPLPFPSRIRIRNGELFFLYKETNYEDVKRLYRMRLNPEG